METFLKIKRPSYEVVLDMDQRIRKYIHSCPFETFPSAADEPPFAYIQRTLVPLYAKTSEFGLPCCAVNDTDRVGAVLLYIHSGYSVEAIRQNPALPLASSYSASLLAAHLIAYEIIEANKRHFTTHPLLFTRWYVANRMLRRISLIPCARWGSWKIRKSSWLIKPNRNLYLVKYSMQQ
jgi:hypothetical protein